jgi:NAD-dependent deacetylase
MNIVFFTGAGMSQESGLPTFRGKDGIWNEIDAEAVASARNWYSGGRSNCVNGCLISLILSAG